MNLFVFIFACVVGKTPKTPKLISMADDAITWGGIRGLGSLMYICDIDTTLQALDPIPTNSILR